jgi:ubiquinone/menaquinone biosynthesis C-methylase UbiE
MREIERFQITGNAADRYERHLIPTLFEPWAKDIIGRARLQPGERVLDIACGTGVVARRAAIQLGDSGSITGLDLNEGMLEMARAQAEKMGAKVKWRRGGTMPFEDSSFNVALCQQGLQFFPDKAAALGEMHRVLMPGGRLVVSVVRSLEHNPLMRMQIEPLTQHLGDVAASVQRAVCSLGDADELRGLHQDAGFQDIDIQVVSLTIQHDDVGVGEEIRCPCQSNHRVEKATVERRTGCVRKRRAEGRKRRADRFRTSRQDRPTDESLPHERSECFGYGE